MIEGTNKNYSEIETKKGKVLLLFSAPWCAPCKALKTILEPLSSEIEDVKFVNVNVDKEQAIAYMFEIMSVPTLLLLDNGKEIKKESENIPLTKQWISNWIINNEKDEI